MSSRTRRLGLRREVLILLPPAVLLLMAVKTGLHAHGPEYSAAQLAAVVGQWPLWIGAGALAGAGVGLLVVALADDR